MEATERERVLHELSVSEIRLVSAVSGLSPEQWTFRESPERWSAAENMEHIVLVEDLIRGSIEKVSQGPPAATPASAANDALILNAAHRRTQRVPARPSLVPAGRYSRPAEAIAALHTTREQTIGFVKSTQMDLRQYAFPHFVFGDLDCYQWLLLIGTHASRHAAQIEELMAHAEYPRAA